MKRLCLAVMALLFAWPVWAEIGDDGLHKAPWMRDTFKDLREDLDEANSEGKRLMVMIEQRGCIYCKKMHEEKILCESGGLCLRPTRCFSPQTWQKICPLIAQPSPKCLVPLGAIRPSTCSTGLLKKAMMVMSPSKNTMLASLRNKQIRACDQSPRRSNYIF